MIIMLVSLIIQQCTETTFQILYNEKTLKKKLLYILYPYF